MQVLRQTEFGIDTQTKHNNTRKSPNTNRIEPPQQASNFPGCRVTPTSHSSIGRYGVYTSYDVGTTYNVPSYVRGISVVCPFFACTMPIRCPFDVPVYKL